jgi:hypothetical protein
MEYDFWNNFEFIELVENMRQKEDPIFAEILERVRVGNSTKDDINKLNERLVKATDPNMNIVDVAVEEYCYKLLD